MKRTLSTTLAVIMAFIAVFCQAADELHPRFDAIREAMIEMTDWSVSRPDMDRFVIVETADSTNFFQYASIGRDRYLFDVPVISLSSEQWELARPYFESEGVQLVYFGDDNAEAQSDRANYAFQKYYGADHIDAGIELGLGFLDQVLGGGARELRILKGWE